MMHAAAFPSADEVHAIAVRDFGLDASSVDMHAPEALAALVRRVASLLSPCSPRVLRETSIRCLAGLVELPSQQLRATIEEIVESLTIYGDLLELPVEGDSTVRLLYLAPPTFVAFERVLFLKGGLSDGVEALPADLVSEVEFRCHTRRLRPADTVEMRKRLQSLGWIDLPRDLWLPPPSRARPEEILEAVDRALSTARTSGDVAGLEILDPSTRTTYYPDRWVKPERKSGRFVARRSQQYGASLWSYVELSDGTVTHLIDLPVNPRLDQSRPCDVAWHLQMAIDAVARRPQRYRIRPGAPAGSVVVDVFSPVPLWAQRRWDVLGEKVAGNASLFGYRFPVAEFAEVVPSLESELFLAAL